MGFESPEQVEAFKEWLAEQMSEMGRYVHTAGLLQEPLAGKTVWSAPHRIFLGKIWSKPRPEKKYWVISGPDMPTDHIEESTAESPREAARHFALRWQLRAERLESRLSADATESDDAGSESWGAVSQNLAAQAELLYQVVEQDRLWDPEQAALDRVLPRS